MSFSNFKETAIEYVKKAVAEDTAGNYESAYKVCCRGGPPDAA